MNFREKTEEIFKKFDIQLETQAIDKLENYMQLLLEWNEKMNLTAITSEEDIILKHFADSLLLLKFTDIGTKSIIDIGTGAGFPGIPLKIARPDIKLTLLDSLGKRLLFLTECVDKLRLKNVSLINGRAEEAVRRDNLREGFPICVSRAVARLNILSELCLPYVEKGGVFVAYKGFDISDELEEAKAAVQKLSGEIAGIEKIRIDAIDYARSLIFIDKIGETPSVFPRKSNTILKKPIK